MKTVKIKIVHHYHKYTQIDEWNIYRVQRQTQTYLGYLIYKGGITEKLGRMDFLINSTGPINVHMKRKKKNLAPTYSIYKYQS